MRFILRIARNIPIVWKVDGEEVGSELVDVVVASDLGASGAAS